MQGMDSTEKPTFSRCLSSAQKRRATVVRKEIEALTTRYPKRRVVTLTLTFAGKGNLPRKECERRYHSLCTHHLSKIFERWVVVFERSKTGRPHYHVVGVLKADVDVQEGFDWKAYDVSCKAGKTWRGKRTKANYALMKRAAREYGRSAPPALKALWKKEFSVATMAKYGFGIAHLTPVKNGEAAATYYAKYLTKENPNDYKYADEDKGMRCYRVGGSGHRACNLRHMPVTRQSYKFRRKLEFAASVLGFDEYAQFQEVCGPRWFYHLGDSIQDLPWQYVKFRLSEDSELLDNPTCQKWSWVIEGREAEDRIWRGFYALFSERDMDIPSPNEIASFPPPGKGEKEFHNSKKQTQLWPA